MSAVFKDGAPAARAAPLAAAACMAAEIAPLVPDPHQELEGQAQEQMLD